MILEVVGECQEGCQDWLAYLDVDFASDQVKEEASRVCIAEIPQQVHLVHDVVLTFAICHQILQVLRL